MPDRERLFLLDGTALAYRSFFAFIRNPLYDSRGRNISAVYGFTMTLFRLLETEKPEERLQALYEQRDPLYREVSDIIVNVGKGSALNTVRKIEQALDNL